jgi:tRNA-2-methylthio-N6-dimethylallyladenosine synthase
MAATKRFHVTTFGCQMNEHDSERMKGMLESLGYAEAPQRDEADLILFNTCSIREAADSRFVAHLHQAKGVKRARPDVVIGVGGCWAQSVKDDVFRQFPFVDVAFGPGQVHKLAEFLTSDSLTAQGYFEFEGFTGHLPAKRAREFQAWVQISVGCNCRCSYCIVPSTRGLEVSRPFDELVEEVRAQVADGAREVTLLGQNVNSYGRDLRPDRRSFAELLGALDAIDGLDRLRYTSPHPKDMREDVIRAHAELGSVCEHIHLPLQSGSSPILKAMRRTYDRGRYLDRVALIREHVPDCAITTDIIVGFPGETEADFAQTLDLVRQARFAGAFTFQYSPRPGTPAASMDGQVPREVVQERYERLTAVQDEASLTANRALVGSTVEVLAAEGEGRKDAATGRRSGRARDGRLVHFGCDVTAVRPGDVVTTAVTYGAPHHLVADGRPLSHRRTAAGDAYEAGRRPTTPGVLLGLPTVRAR